MVQKNMSIKDATYHMTRLHAGSNVLFIIMFQDHDDNWSSATHVTSETEPLT